MKASVLASKELGDFMKERYHVIDVCNTLCMIILNEKKDPYSILSMLIPGQHQFALVIHNYM